jgi:transcriptional regulator with XRE-family HTH domain
MAGRRERLSDQVRKAIESSGLSRYRICKEIDMAEATMSRFMSGQGGLSMEFLDKLADLLNLNITAETRKDQ